MSGLVGVVYAPYPPAQPKNGAQAMPNVAAVARAPRLKARIDAVTANTTMTVTRTVKRVPLANPLTKAWLTVKGQEARADTDAVIQLAITTSTTLGTPGRITDDGHSTGTGTLVFAPTLAQLAALTPGQSYVYDLQIALQDGTTWTAEKGTWLMDAPVTTVTV